VEDFLQNSPLARYIIPTVYAVGGLLFGLFFHSVVGRRIKKMSKKTKWKFDDIITLGIGKYVILWFFLGGIYLGLPSLPVEEATNTIIYQVILLVFITSIAITLSRIASGFIETYAAKSQGALPTTSIFNVLIKGLIYSLAALVVLQTFGISITPILTALGVGGLAIALALQETLSNLFAGLHLIASKKFKPGEFIELKSGEKGKIEDISWRNTTIKTLGGNLVVLTNSKIAGATITNYARPKKELSVSIPLSVSYDSDLEHVEKVVIDVGKIILRSVEGGVESHKPIVRFKSFGESSIDFAVLLKAKEYVSQFAIKHEYIKAIHKRFQEEGINIPFPQREITIKKESVA